MDRSLGMFPSPRNQELGSLIFVSGVAPAPPLPNPDLFVAETRYATVVSRPQGNPTTSRYRSRCGSRPKH